MRWFFAVLLMGALTIPTAANAQSWYYPYCAPGSIPSWDERFTPLVNAIGFLMTSPAECAHQETLQNGDSGYVQRSNFGYALATDTSPVIGYFLFQSDAIWTISSYGRLWYGPTGSDSMALANVDTSGQWIPPLGPPIIIPATPMPTPRPTPIPVPAAVYVPAPSSSLSPSLAGAQLIAQDGTYLGVITSNRYDSDSICNEYGDHGSRYSSTSIRNQYSDYGSQYSSYGAYNQYTSTPPIIISGRQRIGYLTKNRYMDGAIDPDLLIASLGCTYR